MHFLCSSSIFCSLSTISDHHIDDLSSRYCKTCPTALKLTPHFLEDLVSIYVYLNRYKGLGIIWLSCSSFPFLTCRCRWYEIFKHWKYPKMRRINMALWILMTLWQVQFSLVAQLCLTLCNPMDCSMPGLPCNHQLLEFTQTHVHWVGDAIQSSHPLSSPSLPPFNLSQHQGLLKWVSSSHQVAKVLEFQHQSFWWILRTDLL